MPSEREIEAAAIAISGGRKDLWDGFDPFKRASFRTRAMHALSAAARVREEDNAGEPVGYPKILYVCENCQEYNPEMCGHDRRDIYVTPDGRWLCDSCIDGEGTSSRDCTTPPMLYAHPAPLDCGTMEAKPQTVDELFPHCDHWSAKEWFQRLVNAVHSRDDAVRSGDEIAFQTHNNIASSTASRLVHDFAAVILSALTAGKPEQSGWKPIARPLEEWHEDYGDAVWWTWQDGQWLGEPSYIGTPNDSDWPGYHTHWTPHPIFPTPPTAGGGDE